MSREEGFVRTTHGKTPIQYSVRLPNHFSPQPTTLKFHIFDFHNFFDGLIGYDVLNQISAVFDTKSNSLLTPLLSINFNKHNVKPGLNTFEYTIPGHTEMIVEVPMNHVEGNGDFVIPKICIRDLEIPAGIVRAQNGLIKCPLVNNSASQIHVRLDTPLPAIALSEFEISNKTSNKISNKKQDDASNLHIYDLTQSPADMTLFRTEHLNVEEYSTLLSLAKDYRDIYYVEGERLTFAHDIKHVIRTTDENPVYTKSYRHPYIHKEEIQKQMQNMLDQGIIRPSYSPWSSPLWVVPKKLDASGKVKWRIVIDYRKLNAKTIGDKYPLPNISDLLDKLGRCNYFTTLDLASGFHQLEMDPESIPKTAFSTENGHYEYVRMPFGLINAPSTFQRAMDHILRGIQNKFCLIYMDDLIIFSTSLQEHEQHIRQVFDRLRLFNLKIQLDKCEFLRKEVEYLGHLVTTDGVKPNPKKIHAIRNFPIPDTVTKIKGFLGLIGYYRRFIENFATLTKPLTSCLKKGAKIDVTDMTFLQCFNTCKEILCNDPILQYPDFSQAFVLTTDASDVALGSVLSQGKIGQDLPIAYASRTLSDTEQRYSTIEKELLAVVWSVKHFRPYLFGRKFTIVTDHKPLEWLFSLKEPNSKMVRWRLKLEEFDYTIVYKKGTLNQNADALSRIRVPPTELPLPHTEELFLLDDVSSLGAEPADENDLINWEELENMGQETDPDDDDSGATIHSGHENPVAGIPIIEKAINSATHQLVFKLHKNPTTVLTKDLHNRTKRRITIQFPENYTPEILTNFLKANLVPATTYHAYFEDEKLYIDLTRVIQQKLLHNSVKIIKCTSMLIDIESEPEARKIVDQYHVGKTNHRGINETELHLLRRYYWPGMRKMVQSYINNCHICNVTKYDRKPLKLPLNITPTAQKPFEIVHMDVFQIEKLAFCTIIDSFSKYAQMYPIPSKQTTEIANAFLTFISHHGVPTDLLIMDKGPEFRSNVMTEMCKLYSINPHWISSNHPESNGIAERFHSTLIEHFKILRQRPEFKNDTTLTLMRYAVIAYNQSIHSATKQFPMEIISGHLETMSPLNLQPVQTTQAYTTAHKEKCAALFKQIHNTLRQTKEKIINKANEKREPHIPDIPSDTFFRNDRGRQKAKPNFIPAAVTQIDPVRKTAMMGVANKKAGEKIHLNQTRRPKLMRAPHLVVPDGAQPASLDSQSQTRPTSKT